MINRRFISLGMLIASVQGVIILGLAVLVFFISPETLGRIRWLESVLAVAIVFASFGMPTLVFRDAAAAVTISEKGAILLQILKLASFLAVVVAMVSGVAAFYGENYYFRNEHQSVIWAVGLLIPACLLRMMVSFVQGAQLEEKLALHVVVVSGIYLLSLVTATSIFGFSGWIAVRYVGEFSLLILLLYLLRIFLKDGRNTPPKISTLSQLRFGAVANLGFILRVLADHSPVLILKQLSNSVAELGYFGTATVLVFGPLFCLSIVSQYLLPTLIGASNVFSDFSVSYTRFRRVLLMASFVLGVGVVLVGFGLLVFLPEYEGAFFTICILAASLIPRAFLLSYGAVFVASRRYDLAFLMNIIELSFILIFAFAWLGFNSTSMALAVFISALIAAVAGEVCSRLVWKKPVDTSACI